MSCNYDSDYCNLCYSFYIVQTLDLLVILLMFFARAKTRKEYRDIYIGQYVGSVTLIVISLFFAFVLNYVPEKWILGLLGLIPIYLGIKVAIYGDSDGEERAKKELNEKGLSKLIGWYNTIAIVTIASCGADNIGVFVPYFVTLSVTNLLITLFVFLILIFVLVFTAQKLANIPGVGEIVEKFGRWIMSVIYIALGLFIIIENDTIQTILGFIF
jgi:cadmium resistance transport/sequestration family protein